MSANTTPPLFYAAARQQGGFRASEREYLSFFCQKKGTKENHLNLRFKDPLARGGFRRCGGESVSP